MAFAYDPTRQAELKVRLENSRPVEVSDLGRSLQALGEQYKEFVVAQGYDPIPGNAQLFVTHLESGSIIATLQTMLDQTSFMLKHIDVLGGFVGNLNDLVNYFLHFDRAAATPPPVTRPEAERISTILEPIAKDSGSQLNITVTGTTGPVTINTVYVNSEKANAVQNGIRRFLGPSIPIKGRFEREVLYLQQIRAEAKSTVGDRGVIEKFSTKPVKLLFLTPDVKSAILDTPENPFQFAYVVDGEVATVEGQPALYKIAAVHEAIERP
jgi:hypothetical protein